MGKNTTIKYKKVQYGWKDHPDYPHYGWKGKMAYVVGKIMEGYGIKGCDVLITGDKITPADDAYEKRSKRSIWIEVTQQDIL